MTMQHAFTTTLAAALCLAGAAAQAEDCKTGFTATNPDAIYTVHGDGTVTDNRTGLMWKQCLEGQDAANNCANSGTNMTWKNALTHAEGHTFAGYSDWRLPNSKELESLVEHCRENPAINKQIFLNALPSRVWSGSPYAGVSNNAWYVHFGYGNANYDLRSYSYRVRLVRAGQSFAPLPALSAVALQGTPTASSATVAGTSSQTGTGYWLAVPQGSTVPTAAQVKAGANYGSVTVAAHGSASMTASVAASFNATGLSAATAYDFYLVAEASGQLSALAGPVAFTTAAAPVAGACGAAHGGVFTSQPTGSLCSVGNATSVTGTGPWSWSCTGLHGGSDSATCTASLQTWPVTASASPTQGGTATCSPASVAHDGSATCTATASTSYQFSAWTGACAGQTATCTLANVTEAKNSVAQFTQLQYAVTASASPTQGGTATCSPASVAHDGSATCTATASTGYQFSAWTGACAGQAATCTLANVTAAQDSVAQFTQNTLLVPEGPQAGQPLTVAAQPANSWQLAQASTQTVASLNAPALPAGVTLPHGVVRLRLELGTQGSEATVVLTYPQALPAGTVYYKYGKTQDNPQPHWYVFPGAQVSGNTITLTLKDGGAGDDDLQQNRAIDDLGGPAQVAQVAATAPASIPTLGEWALALLAGVLGLFSLGALRRRV